MGFKIAVAGATGNVGREMLNILAERGFPADEVVPLASARSQGTEVSYGDRTLKVRDLATYDFSDTDICLMSAGGNISKEWSPKIGKQGCVVIDNYTQEEIPLKLEMNGKVTGCWLINEENLMTQCPLPDTMQANDILCIKVKK